ncbi:MULTISPECIES: NB-ARC domain-containing protein [Amycolatopsis]|uniref:NB-ARC domain-containing protein n=1 Tax=Amycolatopsis TaxID=1813 RepID=UPI0013046DB8|nr:MULTISPECIES: NB-ARC domain-containing protein [Amycolatopsis]
MRNRFEGDAHNAVQVGNFTGTMQFGAARSEPRGYSLLPPLTAHYTNHEDPLKKLDAIFARRTGRPIVVIVKGPPGSGRTELAVRWVHRHTGDYPDGGPFFVRLGGGLSDSDRLLTGLRTLLLATGEFRAEDLPHSLEGLSALWRDWCRGRSIALVIDDAVLASQVRALMPDEGDSAVLITQARELGTLRVHTVPEEVDIEPMSAEASRELLARIAGERLVAAEPDAIDQLVEVCDGSTIALCVVGMMLADADTDEPAARLARRLARRERVLHELSRDRELSVRAVLDAAYERMDELTQRVYGVLGAHPGSAAVSSRAVAAPLGEPDEDARDGLRGLVRARLVTRADEERVLMLGLVRDHARTKLSRPVMGALIEHYWAHAVSAARVVSPGRIWNRLLDDLRLFDDRATALTWLADEHPNLCATVDEAYRAGVLMRTAQLALALWVLHERGGYGQDMIEVNQRGVAAAEALRDPLLVSVLRTQLGFAHRQRGEYETAAEVLRSALDAAREAGSLEAEATALEGLGLVLLDESDPRAGDVLRENLDLAGRIADERRLALARMHLAKVLEPDEALALLDLARAYFAAHRDQGNVVKTDLWRGRKLCAAGRLAEARELLGGVTSVTGYHRERGEARLALADVARAEGADPVPDLREAERIFTRFGFPREAEMAAARLAGLS